MPSIDEIRDALSEGGRAFLDYWLSVRQEQIMPDRENFDPTAIKPVLPHVVIHELINPKMIRLRLAGTAVVQDYGHEITGMNYLDFVQPDRRPKASEAIFLVRNHPAGMSVSLHSYSDEGNHMVRQSIALPVGDAKQGRKFVYFCSTRNKIATLPPSTPERLAVQGVMDRRFFDIGAGIPEFTD